MNCPNCKNHLSNDNPALKIIEPLIVGVVFRCPHCNHKWTEKINELEESEDYSEEDNYNYCKDVFKAK